MGTTNENFDTYPFKENGNGKPGGGSPTSTQGAELKVTTLTSSDFNDSNEFSFHHNKGTLKFVNIRETVKNTFSTSSFIIPDTHTTKFDVKNKETLSIRRPLVFIRKSDEQLFIPKNLTSLPFSMSFQNVVTTPATSSDYLNSYADITIGNLRTFSGDVHKVKLFTRQQDKQNQEFEKIGEFVLQSKNTLVDESSPTADDPIGIFYSQSVIDNHWVSSSNSTTADNSLIMNAALISGSNRGADDFVEFKTKDRFELEKGEEYILSFSGYFIKGDKVQSDGSVRKSSEIEVLLSGSVVSQTEDTISIGSIGDVGDSSSELFKGNVSGSIPYLYNYVYTHKKSGAKPKAGLVFRVHAGQFHLSNIKFEAVSDQNFNPGFYKTRVPMPITTRRGQRYDFVSEFYDFNNNKAKIEAATSASVLFAGPKQVLADGEDAIFSGSAMIGQSIQMYGVNPAFLRSVGYNGFDKTLAGTGDRDGGFLLWSGSVGSAIGASETYNGVGFEIVQKGANPHQNSFLQFASKYKGGTTSRFRVQTDEFLLGRSGSGTAGDAYISGSGGNLEISSSNFLVSASGDVIMQGTITATAGGTIGGFTVGSTSLSAGNVFQLSSSQNVNDPVSFISSSNFKVSAGGKVTGSNILLTGGTITSDVTVQGTFTANQILTPADAAGIGSASASIDERGNAIFRSGSIGGFRISPTTLFSNSNEFVVTGSTGQITGSKVLFTGGKIGGFNIVSDGLSSINNVFQVTGSTGQITGSNVLFTGGKIGGFEIDADEIKAGSTLILDSDTDSGQIKLGGATSVTNDDGIYMDGTGKFRVGDADGQRISFNSGLLVISSSTFMIGSKAAGKSFISSSVANGLEISSSNFHLSASGKITASAVKLSGDITAQTGNIGGFVIGSSTLTGTNFTLDTSNKRITLGSGDDVFIADADTGLQLGDSTFADAPFSVTEAGVLKAQSGTIGGWTIGGSTISSNNLILNSAGVVETSTYVSGLRGFRLSAADNGFLEVENAKIRGTLRTTVFEKETVNAVGGQLQVGNATTITGSAQISATATQIPVENVSGFTGSEVIMAKKVGNTGFSTEYMLITSQSRRDSTSNTDFSGSLFVVRGYSGSASQSQASGSLGDSPTSATTLEPGQVLVSTGFYNATTRKGSGYIRLNANPNDSATPFMDIVERTGSAIYDIDLKARLGDLSGLSSGLVGSNPGFGLFTNKVFLQGNDPTSASIALGSTPPTSVNYTSNAGIYMDGSGDFLVRGDGDNFIKFDVSDKLSIAAEDFELDAGGLKLIGNSGTAANNQIRLGSATALNTGDGLFASGDGKFRVGADNGHRLEFDGTNLVVSSSDFFLGSKGSNNAYISSSGNVLEISSSKFSLNSDGTVEVEGSISITSGDLAGVTKAKISGSSDALSGSLATRHTLSEATSSTLKTDSGSLAARLQLDANGVNIFNGDDPPVSVAQLTNSLRIGRDVAGQSRLEIDSSGNLSIINRQGSTDTNVIQLLANGNSSFSGSGTFGGAITATSGKIAGWDINSNRLDSTNDKVILDGNNNNGEIRLGSSPPTSATNGAGIYLGGDGTFLVGDADGHRVSFENSKLIVSSSTFFLGSKGSSNAYISSSGDVLEISSSKFALKKNGDVSVEGTVTITGGDLAGVNASTISGSYPPASASQDNSFATQVVLDTDGMALKNAAGTITLADYGADVTIGRTDGTKSNVFIDNNSVDIRTGTKVSASFGATTTIGPTSGQHISIDSDSLDVKSDSSTTLATFGSSILLPVGNITIGNTSAQHIDISSDVFAVKSGSTTHVAMGNTDKAALTLNSTNTSDSSSFMAAPSRTVTAGSGVTGLKVDSEAIINDLFVTDDTNLGGSELTASSNATTTILNDLRYFGTASQATFESDANVVGNDVVFLHESLYDGGDQENDFGTNVTPYRFVGNFKSGNNPAINMRNMRDGTFTIQSNLTKIATNDRPRDKRHSALFIGVNDDTKTRGGVLDQYAFIHAAGNTNEGATSTKFQVDVSGSVIAAGNITAFASSFLSLSDKRWKTDITTFSGSLDKILQLKPRKFKWIKDNKEDYGFIAQEVEEVLPNLVDETSYVQVGDMTEQDTKPYKSVDYSKLTPYLVDTIQQLTKRIEELEKKVK